MEVRQLCPCTAVWSRELDLLWKEEKLSVEGQCGQGLPLPRGLVGVFRGQDR